MSLYLLEKGAAELGLCLDSEMLAKFSIYLRELDKWNRKINLTTIRGAENVSIKHFLDSLTVPANTEVNGKMLDLGSGAGFPGIPIKILCSDLQVCSVDSVEKKIIFQRHITRLLSLQNFTAVHSRGENLAGIYSGYFDFIVSRAFSDIIKFVKIGLPLLAEGGSMIAMKGAEGTRECKAIKGELTEMDISISGITEFSLPITGDRRSLVLMKRNKPNMVLAELVEN